MKSSQLTAEASCVIRLSLILISVILLQPFESIFYVTAQVGGDARGGDATGEVSNCYQCTIVQAPVGGDAQGGNAIGGGSMPSGPTPSGPTPSESMASARITMVYAEQNVWVNGQKGMKIHVSFDTFGLKGKVANVAAYFYFSYGQHLHSSPFQSVTLKSVDNQVSVSTNLNILYDPGTTPDLQLFMPYSGLNLDPRMNRASLAFQVVLFDQSKVPPRAPCWFIIELFYFGQVNEYDLFSNQLVFFA